MRAMTAFFVTFFCLSLNSFVYATEYSLPRLSVQGNEILQDNSGPITLRGVSLCSLEWHKPLEQIQTVTKSPLQWNVNVLRLPIQVKEWDRVGAQSYIKDYLDPAVKLCQKNNVYCIIDWHEIGAWDDPIIIQKLEKFWSITAPRYAAHKNILYEIFNEPTTPSAMTKENWENWKKTAQKWVDSIRRDAPHTLLLIGSPHWSQMTKFAKDSPFNGKNLAYVMHLYPNWNKNMWDELLGEPAKNVPVFVTEWGWSSQKNNKNAVFYGDVESYGQPFKDYLNARPHIHWTAWSYDPHCGPAMLGQDQDMGAFVKEWLDEGNVRP